MIHFKAAAKIIFLSDLTCDNTHVLVRCNNYDDSDTLQAHRLTYKVCRPAAALLNI